MKTIGKLILKKLIIEIRAKNPALLYDLISKYKYISFDIFDTLVKRQVENPSDIFDLVEKEYNKNHPVITNFKKERLRAEQKARKRTHLQEVTLHEIYKYLDYSKETKNTLIKLEKETEINSCYPNHIMQKIYHRCLQEHKKIILTSDMYLDSTTIHKLLEKNGYSNYDKLYLSSEHKISKRKGKLYRLILQENHIPPNQMLHIGDDPISDYLIAKKYHIHSVLIR